MKRNLLFLAIAILFSLQSQAQQLYSNSNPVSYYRTGNGQLGTPKVIIDDIMIPSSTIGGADSIRFTKLNFGLARLAGAPATTLTVFYTTLEDTATFNNNLIKIPPTVIGTIAVPAQGTTSEYRVFSIGDSLSRLFAVKADTGNLFTNYQTVFVGLRFSDTTRTGWAIASGAPNYNRFWIYNADSAAPRAAYAFSNANPPSPNAAFFVQAYGQMVSLPVELASFTAIKLQDYIRLAWTTKSENNNSGFWIERSIDGMNFKTVGFVKSQFENGFGSTATDYQFNDEYNFAGNIYYRLKQVDKDGKYSYSNVAMVKGDNNSKLQITRTYPNPAVKEINMQLSSALSGKIDVTVVDVAGRIVLTRQVQLSNGDNQIQLNIGSLNAGAYIIKLSSGTGAIATQQFIKQ